MDRFVLMSFADSHRHAKAANVIVDAAWHDMSFLNFTHSHYEYYVRLMEHYKDYQLCLVDRERDYVIAAANTVPLYTPNPYELPQTGWDWILRTAFETMDRQSNVLAGIAISVAANWRGKGIARRMIKAMQDLCTERGFDRLILPVRPSAKHRFPDVAIEDYIHWKNDRGQVFDPWLRSHVSMGGRIQGICSESMVVEEPVGFWEAWTGKSIEHSGQMAIEKGIVPVEIDMERNIGRYAEPNVWVVYPGAREAALAA